MGLPAGELLDLEECVEPVSLEDHPANVEGMHNTVNRGL